MTPQTPKAIQCIFPLAKEPNKVVIISQEFKQISMQILVYIESKHVLAAFRLIQKPILMLPLKLFAKSNTVFKNRSRHQSKYQKTVLLRPEYKQNFDFHIKLQTQYFCHINKRSTTQLARWSKSPSVW